MENYNKFSSVFKEELLDSVARLDEFVTICLVGIKV
jgi:hypothetical protein